jgi:hypothetical protein
MSSIKKERGLFRRAVTCHISIVMSHFSCRQSTPDLRWHDLRHERCRSGALSSLLRLVTVFQGGHGNGLRASRSREPVDHAGKDHATHDGDNTLSRKRLSRGEPFRLIATTINAAASDGTLIRLISSRRADRWCNERSSR